MQVVDAYWELRNLGVSTQECTVEINDTVKDVLSGINQLNADYQVVKVPVGKIEINEALGKQGFTFIENSIEISHSLEDIPLTKLMKRMKDSINYRRMNEEDYDFLFSQVQQGMFRTDRVYLDPFFSSAQAANRYVGWLKDELKRGSMFFRFSYKEEPIGFICCRLDQYRVMDAVFGGLYIANSAKAFGSTLMTRQVEIAKDLGAKKLITHISSNNLPVVRVYSSLGYQIEKMNYVFIKHKK